MGPKPSRQPRIVVKTRPDPSGGTALSHDNTAASSNAEHMCPAGKQNLTTLRYQHLTQMYSSTANISAIHAGKPESLYSSEYRERERERVLLINQSINPFIHALNNNKYVEPSLNPYHSARGGPIARIGTQQAETFPG